MEVQIPRAFYDDHAERELPTPEPLRETKRHVWIDTADPAFSELVADAKHYADPYVMQASTTQRYGLAAKALLKAVAHVL